MRNVREMNGYKTDNIHNKAALITSEITASIRNTKRKAIMLMKTNDVASIVRVPFLKMHFTCWSMSFVPKTGSP